MTNDDDFQPPKGLSDSEQENLEILARFYEKEDSEVSRVQAAIESISNFFGSPGYFAFAVVFIACWIGVNTWGHFHLWRHLDEPPFFYLQGIVSANALMLTIAVLIRQNRMSQLAAHRAHLDLQINLLTEQKVTKLLQIQQSLDAGSIKGSEDSGQAVELTKAADPEAILAAIKQNESVR